VIDENDEAKRECARNAFGSLPGIERWFCGALILRQVEHGPWTPREVAKYGPEGCVKVCSSRALRTYCYPIGILTVGFAIAGVASVAIGLFVVVLVMSGLAIARAISAAKDGKRWRASPRGNGETTADTR
jgi:hypothetical protein